MSLLPRTNYAFSGPDIVELDFNGDRHMQQKWLDTAENHAEALGVEVHYKVSETGSLLLAFENGSDISRLQHAMKQDWNTVGIDKIERSLGYVQQASKAEGIKFDPLESRALQAADKGVDLSNCDAQHDKAYLQWINDL